VIEGVSPLRGLSEATVSESSRMTTRKCEMEAGYESQHRTQVNLGTGYVGWASVRRITTPDIRSFPWSTQGEGGETLLNLTPRDLVRSGVFTSKTYAGRTNGGNDNGPMSYEKSDHPIVALKLSNVGGAKGVTC
jgi:hypothetical protein